MRLVPLWIGTPEPLLLGTFGVFGCYLSGGGNKLRIMCIGTRNDCSPHRTERNVVARLGVNFLRGRVDWMAVRTIVWTILMEGWKANC